MTVTCSILVAALVACLAYRILFYDSGDFWDGCAKFGTLFFRRRRRYWPSEALPPPAKPEDFEDESWSSGIRFLVFLAASLGSGYFAYQELHKHLG